MFFYSLSIFFNQMNLGTPLELAAIVMIITFALYLSTPFPDNHFIAKSNPFSIYSYCVYAWSAQLSLQAVFWPFFILFNFGIFTADYLAKAGEISMSSWDDIHLMLLLPSLIWSISVWRSSANAQSRWLMTLTRLLTITVGFEYLLKALIRAEYTPLFFNCEDKLVDYISCF